ncbi:hypothetical protein H1S01_04855 [Heliobacterium chlorum]|uniref:Uncharacterized protein n=1 Tax=Heliobacterium chlorum TaxID=2698 RepID=A0ABR7T0X0_HELCL|nr:hypothetical protein [Heliobacterium chlorum]MBC9783837.1 hypothetical protein [Heliobacterium chlorum]
MTFLQPLSVVFRQYDVHVIFFLKSHSHYDAIEAMIQHRKDQTPLIRIIVTHTDQSQADIINDAAIVEALQRTTINRPVLYSPIRYERSTHLGKPEVHIEFRSLRDEEIVLHFTAALKTSQRYAGLIDPLRHAEKDSLPVMYRERSTLAGPKSYVMIDNSRCQIPRKVWVPLFFTGLKAFYSEVFSIGVLRSDTRQLTRLHSPSELLVGEQWIYRCNGKEICYRLLEVTTKELRIVSVNERITVSNCAKGFKLARICVESNSGEKGIGQFLITFTPPLPLSQVIERVKATPSYVHFSISIDHHRDLVNGKVYSTFEGDRQKLLLVPQQPQWALKRPLRLLIQKEGNQFTISTELIPQIALQEELSKMKSPEQ